MFSRLYEEAPMVRETHASCSSQSPCCLSGLKSCGCSSTTTSGSEDLIIRSVFLHSTDFLMEDFEDPVLSRAAYNFMCWFRYVVHTFVVWPFGPEKPNCFLTCLNSKHQNFHFSMEIMSDGHIPFLDI
jgi:hypothetical protein